MKQRIGWIALAGAGIAVVVGMTVRMAISSMSSQPERIALVRPLACSACHHNYDGEATRPPVECPKCQQRTVWPALRCTNCRSVVACDQRKFRGEGREPYCPKCQSTQLTEADR